MHVRPGKLIAIRYAICVWCMVLGEYAWLNTMVHAWMAVNPDGWECEMIKENMAWASGKLCDLPLSAMWWIPITWASCDLQILP